ncbi:MAG: PAC2 family protein [Methanocorpusculum sp.]|nr:PAC2 family protein [Methanocorpusculum sp.]
MSIYDNVRIVSEIPSANDVILIAGFPGSGLVGSIAVQFLIDKLAFRHIGDIAAPDLPTGSLAEMGLARAPIRLYEKDNIVAITSDVPIPEVSSYFIAAEVIEWLSDKCRISEIVVIGGVVTGGEGERVFGVANTEEGLEKIKQTCQILPAMNIAGITGEFLTEAVLKKIPACGFLIETNYDIDSRASAAGLDVISQMYELALDTTPLVEQADSVEPMLKQLSDGVKKSEQRETSFEEDLMYG